MIAGGILAGAAGARAALLIAGPLCLASALPLPWWEAPTAAGAVPARAAEAASEAPRA